MENQYPGLPKPGYRGNERAVGAFQRVGEPRDMTAQTMESGGQGTVCDPAVVVARDSGGTRHAAWAWAWDSSPRVVDLIPKSEGAEPGDQGQTMNAAGGHLMGLEVLSQLCMGSGLPRHTHGSFQRPR